MSNKKASSAAPAASSESEQGFDIQRLYLKDVSFESPNAPVIFTKEFQPETNLDLHSAHRVLQDNIFEVELNITVTVGSGEETAYLVEVKYAGIFTIQGYEDEQLAHLLGSYCPSMMYPYVREIISDLAVKGGFPQMLLAPINFDALYMQNLQEQQGEASESPAKGDSTKH